MQKGDLVAVDICTPGCVGHRFYNSIKSPARILHCNNEIGLVLDEVNESRTLNGNKVLVVLFTDFVLNCAKEHYFRKTG